MISEKMIAPCGQNCALCENMLREKNPCPGCNEPDEQRPESCAKWCEINNCAERDGFCDSCEKYPCGKIQSLEELYKTHPAQESPMENLRMRREQGMKALLERENARWHCDCGGVICVHTGFCSRCGRFSVKAAGPVLRDVCAARPTVWRNPRRDDSLEAGAATAGGLTLNDVCDAAERLQRFAPLLAKLFPETAQGGGVIESALQQTPTLARQLGMPGKVLVKRDGDLPIAGSVKARGGIYEVLCHTEQLALEAGLLHPGDDYALLAEPRCCEFFARHTVQVGSTGNLGMSIGIMAAALGYRAIVHMSQDAKQWKKDLLRGHGVEVREYSADYSLAVQQGRKASDADPNSYFVDDENSRRLFLGYAVAGLRLKKQLEAQRIAVDEAHPLAVYIPCGVGGAPGGIAFGLRCAFGAAAHVYFAEPTQAPCMLVGMATGLDNAVCVQDFGLTGLTEADGLAVGRASGFVGKTMRPHISGIATVDDEALFKRMKQLYDAEGIYAEPSACAGIEAAAMLRTEEHGAARENITHIIWATGGKLVPAEVRAQFIARAE